MARERKVLFTIWLAVLVTLIFMILGCENQGNRASTDADVVDNPSEDFVYFVGLNKEVFFIPPSGWEITDSSSDNISRNYRKVGGTQGLLFYHHEICEDFVEGLYEDGMSMSEYRERIENSDLNIANIYSLEIAEDLSLGAAVKVAISGIEEGIDVTYFWVTESEFLSLSFSGMPEDREELERLAYEVARSATVEGGLL